MMPTDRPTTSDIDILQRSAAPPALGSQAGIAVPPGRREVVRVTAVGRQNKSTDDIRRSNSLVAESIVIGAQTCKLPLCGLVVGSGSEVSISVGTWADTDDAVTAGAGASRLQALKSLVLGAYAAVDFGELPTVLTQLPPALDQCGLVLGIPSATPAPDGTLPFDRLIRAMGDQPWASLVLAQPMSDAAMTTLRNSVTNEIRLFERTSASADRPDPITRYYNELLDSLLRSTSSGQAIGAWRTSAYLLGTRESYPRLAGLWRGLFSQRQTRGEPLRVWPCPGGAQLAQFWAIPDSPPAPQDRAGRYNAPFQFQTVLTSTQLASYFHLPEFETPGFAVKADPGLDFDTEPVMIGNEAKSLVIGHVISGAARPVGSEYRVGASNLTRHAFITGVTGSGKTVTAFNLVRGLDGLGIPFLVIEPTKSEYRSLTGDLNQPKDEHPPLGRRIRIFTLGSERESPFRLNPFEPGGEQTPIGLHIDMLRSVFSAAFGMWTPLPQVLERCLYEIYTDRGWDFASGENRRGRGTRPGAAFPTLTDLSLKVDDVVSRLGYADEITSNIKAALTTRVDGLRAGGKGRMLDVPRSFPMDVLLNGPTVLELEGMGDDDDKAFLMGLLLVRLVEYRREQAAKAPNLSRDLQHLLVIEEAHRLLTNVAAGGDPEQANPRGKAVEAFTNLLSEIRAYGQGVAIIDQVPVRLAPDVIKNTDLKIVHRIVAGDDREVLGLAMAMEQQQTRAIATLERGQAAVFHEGDDAPLLVKILPPTESANGVDIARMMAWWRHELRLEPLLRRSEACLTVCNDLSVCDEARAIVGESAAQRTFARLVLTLAESRTTLQAIDGPWFELQSVVSSRMSPDSSLERLLPSVIVHAAEWFALRRGAQNMWTFIQADALEAKIRSVLLNTLADPHKVDIDAFQAAFHQLHLRTYEPFSRCARICAQRTPPVCLYRWAAADSLREFAAERQAADRAPAPPSWRLRVWSATESPTQRIVGIQEGLIGADPAIGDSNPRRRAALCLLQQSFELDTGLSHAVAAARMDALLAEPGGQS